MLYCTLELAKGHWTELPKHGIVVGTSNELDRTPESDARIRAAIVEGVAKDRGLMRGMHW